MNVLLSVVRHQSVLPPAFTTTSMHVRRPRRPRHLRHKRALAERWRRTAQQKRRLRLSTMPPTIRAPVLCLVKRVLFVQISKLLQILCNFVLSLRQYTSHCCRCSIMRLLFDCILYSLHCI
jgi:hypothetical protein